ncbi:unnamed protein product [Adineta ricciae]|uniref:Peptidase C14 caspase domain-containing protein n=1 Tax=Adineta ricciae TaxID=249248 RepID=A0A815DJW5_ADIRI|nr:unnamed protein product [Adineta ricciae]
MFQKQALVIGNSAYVHQARSSSVHDASDMSYLLRSIGFLTHSAVNLNTIDLLERTNRFLQSIQANSIVLLYFSGLAVQYDGNTYLMPTNNHVVNTDTVKELSLNIDQYIGNIVNKSPRAIIVILDCYRPPQSIITLTPFFDREPLGLTQGLAPIRPPPSTVIAYSCSLGSTFNALANNGRNSLYTYYLLHYLRMPNVDIDTVLKYVALNVQRDTANKQIPERYSNVQEYLCLVGNPYVKSAGWFDGTRSDSALLSNDDHLNSLETVNIHNEVKSFLSPFNQSLHMLTLEFCCNRIKILDELDFVDLNSNHIESIYPLAFNGTMIRHLDLSANFFSSLKTTKIVYGNRFKLKNHTTSVRI